MTENTEEDVEQAVDAATEAVRVQAEQLPEFADTAATGDPMGLPHLLDVPVQVTVEVGRTRLSLAQLVELGAGSLIELDREAHEPADILVNGKVVARGEVVTIDESYGVRITSVHDR
ncbi:MAG: flagellar motor switch protein FliN [Planctomycetota bacterium]